MMKRFLLGVLIGVLASGFSLAAERNHDAVYQLAPLPALVAGLFDGMHSYQDVLQKGDFGIGTFHGLEGEMILLDGTLYQVLVDGRVMRPGPAITTPFATVKYFKADQDGTLEGPMDYKELSGFLDAQLRTLNLPVAVRIEGEFETIKARSVPAYEEPYPTLGEALEHQRIFEMTNATGTAVGFRFPASLSGVQAVGYHLHFITQDREAGGHLLDFRLRNVRYELDYAHELLLEFPRSEAFYSLP